MEKALVTLVVVFVFITLATFAVVQPAEKKIIEDKIDSVNSAYQTKIAKLEYNRDLALKLEAHEWFLRDRYTITSEPNDKGETVYFESPINALGLYGENPGPEIKVRFYVPTKEEIESFCGYSDDYLLCDGLLLCKVIN